MGECLRVVALVGASGRVDFFREKSEGVGAAGELVEEPYGFREVAGHGERLDEPEGAGKEGSFAAGEPVAAGRIPVKQRAPSAEVAADGGDRAAPPGGGTRL